VILKSKPSRSAILPPRHDYVHPHRTNYHRRPCPLPLPLCPHTPPAQGPFSSPSPRPTSRELDLWKYDTHLLVSLSSVRRPSSCLHLASAYRRFEEWTKTYGPVFSLRQGFTTVIIVGRYQAAVEIMEREGASLADRPVSIAAGETLSGGMRVLLTPAGERFKKMRKSVSLLRCSVGHR
jgi:hypothetical protein